MEHKTFLTNTLSSIENESIEMRPFDIVTKFSQKTSVSNVNVSNDNFVCLKLAPRIRGKT